MRTVFRSFSLLLLSFVYTSAVQAVTLGEVDSLLAVYESSDGNRLQVGNRILDLTSGKAVFFDSVPRLDASMSADGQDLVVLFSVVRWMTTCSYFSEALQVIDRALPLAASCGNARLESTMLCDKAYCLYKLSDYTSSIEAGREAAHLSDRCGNLMQLSRAYLYMSLVNYGIRNYDEAIELVELAIETNAKLGTNIQTHNTLGIACELYCGAGKVDKAIEYGHKAVAAAREIGYRPGVANHLTQLSYAYDRSGDYQLGLQSAEEAISIVRETEPLDRNQLAISLEFKAWNLIDMGRHSEAVDVLREAIVLEEAVGNRQAVCYDYRTLYEALEPSDAREALAALKRYTVMADSLHSIQLKELMTKANAELHNDDLKRKNEESSQRLRYAIWITIAIVLLLSIIIVSLWYAFSQKRRSEEALRLLTEAREAFFTNVTHEFRTPLTVILGLGRELEKDDSGKLHETGAMIVRSGERLLTLVNQMLDISKVKSAIGEQPMQRGDLAAYMAMIVETHKEVARQKGVSVVYESEKGGIQTAFVADYINKITDNLVGNAVKFTPSGGRVDVSLHLLGDIIEFRVKDTGYGISESDLPHIFEPFYRADNAEGTGSGVGLALVKQILDAIGGSIDVESQLDKGSCFVVRLSRVDMRDAAYVRMPESDTRTPEANGMLSAGSAQRPVGRLTDGGGDVMSILVVEDNADVSHFIGGLLSDRYDVCYAADGRQGIEMARELMPDLIITDLMMPHTDGLQLCRAVREDVNTDHIPIIVVTAKATDEDRIRGLKAGADCYLTKPFNADELRVCIENIFVQRDRLLRRFGSDAASIQSADGHVDEVDLGADSADMSSSSMSAVAFMGKVEEIVNRLLPDNCSVEALAQEMYMSQRTLQRKMISIAGTTPKKYIMDTRFKMACRMIEEYPDRTIDDIATACGYHDASHFIHAFQSTFGVSPRSYKQKA